MERIYKYHFKGCIIKIESYKKKKRTIIFDNKYIAKTALESARKYYPNFDLFYSELLRSGGRDNYDLHTREG